MENKCVFCGRTHTLHTVLGRQVCVACWDIIAYIAIKAVGRNIGSRLQEAEREIEEGL